MYSTPTTPERCRWEVVWFSKGKWVRKDCGTDFALATDVFAKLILMEKAGVTLKSKNMSFPPPEKYADTETVKFRVRNKRTGKVSVKERQEVVYPLQWTTVMHGYNVRGWWWCPLCCKMRKFVKGELTVRYEGANHGDSRMQCPACGVSGNHGSVIKYNPLAVRPVGRRTRSDKGVRRG